METILAIVFTVVWLLALVACLPIPSVIGSRAMYLFMLFMAKVNARNELSRQQMLAKISEYKNKL